MHEDKHACMDGYLCIRMCACMHACMHAHAHIHMYTQGQACIYSRHALDYPSLTHKLVRKGDRSILDPQLEPTSALAVGVPNEATPAVQQAVSPVPMQADFNPGAKNKPHNEDKQMYDKHRPFFGLRDVWKDSPQVATRETRCC